MAKKSAVIILFLFCISGYSQIRFGGSLPTSPTFTTVNATNYQQAGVAISWGASTVSQTGLNQSFPDAYASLDSLTLAAGTYCITYSMQVRFLAGSGVTTGDSAYVQIYSGSALTNSEIYVGYAYTVVGVSGDLRVMSWNVVVTPSTTTKYYIQTKQVSHTGLTVKLFGYVMSAIKVK